MTNKGLDCGESKLLLNIIMVAIYRGYTKGNLVWSIASVLCIYL